MAQSAERSTHLSCRVPEVVGERLFALSRAANAPMGEIIRQALFLGIMQMQKEVKYGSDSQLPDPAH